ncbi:hypothetical protein BLNAU_5721 [Blattamonas nauphoetae]|uniref:Uncharacterized protein n=1 Tax=Blattamonas nauphoetae TaxID=2049346 RepID=A0ABQ9Y6L7_9EUKA|nr:hypothetical protein BLNAU_5721 [Blattamonas nauphoetae]
MSRHRPSGDVTSEFSKFHVFYIIISHHPIVFPDKVHCGTFLHIEGFPMTSTKTLAIPTSQPLHPNIIDWRHSPSNGEQHSQPPLPTQLAPDKCTDIPHTERGQSGVECEGKHHCLASLVRFEGWNSRDQRMRIQCIQINNNHNSTVHSWIIKQYNLSHVEFHFVLPPEHQVEWSNSVERCSEGCCFGDKLCCGEWVGEFVVVGLAVNAVTVSKFMTKSTLILLTYTFQSSIT